MTPPFCVPCDTTPCVTVILAMPWLQDMHKLMNKDKIILRFTARMTPGSSVSHADAGRRFVLSYFMMDDSLLIFEPPVRNSGIIGGKFLERQRVYKPQSEEIYTYQVWRNGLPVHGGWQSTHDAMLSILRLSRREAGGAAADGFLAMLQAQSTTGPPQRVSQCLLAPCCAPVQLPVCC